LGANARKEVPERWIDSTGALDTRVYHTRVSAGAGADGADAEQPVAVHAVDTATAIVSAIAAALR
jgi:hypothetical protein